MTNLNQKKGDWILLTPVHGISLTEELNEFRICRVNLFSKTKLLRIGGRFGLKSRVKNIINYNSTIANEFEKYSTFACIRFKGTPKVKWMSLRLLLMMN